MKKMAMFLALALVNQPAQAAFYFGTEEDLRLVQDTEMTGPNGEDLQISRLVIRKSFLLPYAVSDGGLVFSIKGKRDAYYPLPDASKVKESQLAGILPTPLPSSALSKFDLITGYALWEALLGLLLWSGIKSLFKRGASSELA